MPQFRSGRETSALLGRPTPRHSRKKLQKKETSVQFPRRVLSMKSLQGGVVREAHWLKPPRHHSNWPGTTVTICMNCFMTGGPGKEQGTNKPPPTGRVWERSKEDATCPTTSQNPSCWHPSWLNNACTTRKDSESEGLIKDKMKGESHSIVSDSLQPHDYTVRGILQARILEWVAIHFSRGPSQPRDQTPVSHFAGGFFTSWATREAQEYWSW